jgi:hypothetical protein
MVHKLCRQMKSYAAVIRSTSGRGKDALSSLLVLESAAKLGTVMVTHHTGIVAELP